MRELTGGRRERGRADPGRVRAGPPRVALVAALVVPRVEIGVVVLAAHLEQVRVVGHQHRGDAGAAEVVGERVLPHLDRAPRPPEEVERAAQDVVAGGDARQRTGVVTREAARARARSGRAPACRTRGRRTTRACDGSSCRAARPRRCGEARFGDLEAPGRGPEGRARWLWCRGAGHTAAVIARSSDGGSARGGPGGRVRRRRLPQRARARGGPPGGPARARRSLVHRFDRTGRDAAGHELRREVGAVHARPPTGSTMTMPPCWRPTVSTRCGSAWCSSSSCRSPAGSTRPTSSRSRAPCGSSPVTASTPCSTSTRTATVRRPMATACRRGRR